MMSGNVVKINVTPGSADEEAQRTMALNMVNTARRIRSDDYMYKYDFGFKKMGDTLIDLKQNTYQWHTPQNVEFTLVCSANPGQSISFVDIKVDQSSAEHDAKVVAGGIGKDSIEILITARNTYWFKYDARSYGAATLLRLPLEKLKHAE